MVPLATRSTAASALENALGRLRDHPAEEAQDLLGVVGVARLAGERAEPHEGHRGDRVGRRRGVVHQILLAGDELLAVVGGGEHAPVVDVPEVVEQRVGDGRACVDPAGLAGRLARAG